MRLLSVAERFDPEALDALEQRLVLEQSRRQARKSLTAWCRYNGYEPARHHQLIIDHLEELASGTSIDRLAIFAPPGSAKALALDTPIPTPSGWRLMGELRVGDKVLDETGAPCSVTRVSEIW